MEALCKIFIWYSGLPWAGKSQGKSKLFQGQAKVSEFLKRSGKFFDIVKVSEKSGNLLVQSNALHTKSRQKPKEVENEEKNINGLQKKLKQM